MNLTKDQLEILRHIVTASVDRFDGSRLRYQARGETDRATSIGKQAGKMREILEKIARDLHEPTPFEDDYDRWAKGYVFGKQEVLGDWADGLPVNARPAMYLAYDMKMPS